MRIRLLATVTVITTLTSCGGGDGTGSEKSIPSVQLECSSAQVGDCSLDGKMAYAGLIESLVLDCDGTLHGLTASQRQQLFAVTGSAVASRTGIYLIARISSWFNNSGGSQNVLNSGNYPVCAFIDSNGNGQLDTGEPVGSGQTATGAGTYVLSSWAAAR